ncbi:GNAT family N-acetyltransferase [Falsibacillus albus]|uniref:N-acetyltransferase n=1 Tax=Falsibacillus albus TaxID=2478915 RepID=A0A3L7K4C8_9BACI|nr:GNAT family N-acetyltransferase [Falsibacillus albus]RLQ97505.1 N-acetyltransferase [Falsibacillus albus]
MIKRLDIKNQKTAEQIRELQQAAYQVEARLIDFSDLPPLVETVNDIMALDEIFFGFIVDGKWIAGALSFELEEDESATICRMMVHPDAHRKGIAGKLLEEFFKETSFCTKWQVTTGAANEPAKRLYAKHGFYEDRQFEVVPGLMISSFVKENTR